jgi:uroporphyrinogen decarboxylase
MHACLFQMEASLWFTGIIETASASQEAAIRTGLSKPIKDNIERSFDKQTMKPYLTSRQRVVKAINHQEPDRVPFNLNLTVDIYHRLRNYLGLPVEHEKSMGVWTDVSPSMDLVEAMQVDFCYVGLKTPSSKKIEVRQDGLLYDEWGIGRKKVVRQDGSFYFEMVKHPLAGATLKDIDDYPWPDPADPERIQGLRERILKLRQDTDKAIMAKFSNSIWEQSWWLFGLQDWFEKLATDPQIPCAIMERVSQVALGTMEAGLDAAGDLVDIVRLSGEDLGTQKAPMISPHMFVNYVQPYFARLWSLAKAKLREKNSPARLALHSCGNVRPFIPVWIEMGLDILDPIQPKAQGMEPAGLKRDFGDRLVFHGGIDIQEILPFGSPADVMQEVRRYIQVLGPGGGYIVAPAHNVQSDVPPENLVAIRDAIGEYGYYPITGDTQNPP